MSKNISIDSAIFQSLSQPIIICEKNNKIIHANYAAESFFGVSYQALIKTTLDDYLSFGSPILSLVEGVLNRKAPMSEYKMKVAPTRVAPTRNAEVKTVDVFATPVSGFEGQVALLFQERTMADKMDRQLVSQSAVRSVVGLSAMLTHEIKNPLSGIRGAAQLLEKSVPTQDIVLAKLICDETDRIVNLLNKVDVFGDERPLEGEELNIHIVLDRVKLLAKSGFAKDIDFIENYDPSLPLIYGNLDHLVQVFLNLIKNAAQALKDITNPQISLSTAYKPGIHMSVAGSNKRISLPFEIIIQDNGAGVPAHILPNMFDPFVTTKPNGSGLGLAMVAKIIGEHGGVIDVESHVGSTKFKILLPLADKKPKSLENKESKSLENKKSKSFENKEIAK